MLQNESLKKEKLSRLLPTGMCKLYIDKGLLSGLYKQLFQLNRKTTQFKMVKGMNRYL